MASAYTLDTNIMILHLKEEGSVVAFLNRLIDANAELNLSKSLVPPPA